MTQDYLDLARKMLTEAHPVTQHIEGATYTPSEMQVQSLARSLALHDAELLEREAEHFEGVSSMVMNIEDMSLENRRTMEADILGVALSLRSRAASIREKGEAR